MQDSFFAVIDTNVLVSALISKTLESNPVKIVRAITQGRIIPLYNEEILDEYREVLSRPKFCIEKILIHELVKAIVVDGLRLDRTPTKGIVFPDPKDVVFYEVTLSKDDSYLITGNIKHFPASSCVVTPAEMVSILERQ